MVSGKRSDVPVMIIAVAMIAVILIGEVVVYTSDYTDYSADASMEDGVISYTVSADGSKTYSVVVSSNGSKIQTLYLYYDETYPSDVEDIEADVGAPALTQSYHLSQLVQLLEYRGVTDVVYVNAAELRSTLEGLVADGSSSGTGLVCMSGVLPETVYTGSSEDLIFQWLSDGGYLYWAGNLIGYGYGTADGEIVEVENYQELFFGSACLNTGETDRVYDECSDNGYVSALSLQNNHVKYGVNADLITGRSALSLGFEGDGYASITAVSYGGGAIFVFGGDYIDYQRYDMAQVIAAGIGPDSEIVEVATGSVKGTCEGTVTVEAEKFDGLSAYIYLGGYYVVYGTYCDLQTPEDGQ